MSNIECADCGVTALQILSEGVDPEFWFGRGDDGTVLCRGCHVIRVADRRFAAGDW